MVGWEGALTGAFIGVLNMSLTACVMVLAVLVIRALLCRRARIFSYLLWGWPWALVGVVLSSLLLSLLIEYIGIALTSEMIAEFAAGVRALLERPDWRSCRLTVPGDRPYRPARQPQTKPVIREAIRGRFRRTATPYRAGSVVPAIRAEEAAARAVWRSRILNSA